MALGNITIRREGAFGAPGSRKHAVAAGAVGSIKAGELVLKVLGSPSVVVWTASEDTLPAVGTDYIVGISATTSTDTAGAAGTVEIIPITKGMVLMGDAVLASDIDTQAKYNALVGDRVTLDTTAAGVQTLNTSDGATNGLVIEPSDISKAPGKIAFSVRRACIYNA